MKARQLQRLMQEFPWLWAIESNWFTDTVEIQVTKATAIAFAELVLFRAKEELWCYFSDTSDLVGFMCCRKAEPIDGNEFANSLVTLAFKTIMAVKGGKGGYIKYVAHIKRREDGSIKSATIYRAPCWSVALYRFIVDLKNNLSH